MNLRPLVKILRFETWPRLVLLALVICAINWPASVFAAKKQVSAIFVNGNVETIDNAGTVAEAVAISEGKFVAVGSTAAILAQYQSATMVDLRGDTVLPGFIDTHSHMQGWGGLADPKFWLDLSTANVFLKPLPSDTTRCANPLDPQSCFIRCRRRRM